MQNSESTTDLVYINKKYAEISKTYENLRSKLKT
jgi:hypothetical protein